MWIFDYMEVSAPKPPCCSRVNCIYSWGLGESDLCHDYVITLFYNTIQLIQYILMLIDNELSMFWINNNILK